MPSPNAIRAGRAFVELFADDSKLNTALANAQKRVEAFGSGLRAAGTWMAGLGGGAIAGLMGAVKVYTDLGEKLELMSVKTGVSVESLSELSYAADQSGSSIDTVNDALVSMSRTIVSAGLGMKRSVTALRLLGLTFEDLRGLSPEAQFKLIADRLSALTDPTLKTAAAMRVLGGAGVTLLPMLAQGAAGIEALEDKARALGLTISGKSAQDAKEFSDSVKAMWMVATRAAFAVGEALVPALRGTVEWFTKLAGGAAKWISQNRGIVVLAFDAAVAVAGVGTALIVMGTALVLASKAIGALGTLLTAAGAGMNMMIGLAGALVTPLGLLTTAVIGFGAYLVYTSGAGARAIRYLGEEFSDLKRVAVTAADGVVKALSAGDIELAGRILWTALRLVWLEGVAELNKAALELKDFWYGLTLDIGERWLKMINQLKNAWVGFKDWYYGTGSDLIKWTAQNASDWVFKSVGTTREDFLKALDQVTNAKRDALLNEADQNDREFQGAMKAGNQMADQRVNESGKKIAVQTAADQAKLDALKAQLAALHQKADAEANAGSDDIALRALRENLRLGSQPQFAGMPDLMAAKTQLAGLEARGTFNPYEALAAFGSGGALDQLVKSAQDIAANTKETADNTEDMGLDFAQ